MLSRFKSLSTIIKAAIIISILAVILSFIPILNIIGLILGFIALIIGLINVFSDQLKSNPNSKQATIFGMLISFFAIIISILTISLLNNGSDTSSDTSDSETSISSKSTKNESDEDEDADDKDEDSESSIDPTSYDTGITYDQLARNPDDHEEDKVSFTGVVVQVMEDGNATQLRVAVDGDADNIILATILDNDILNNSRVLENDLITIKGTSDGVTTYESTEGEDVTIPEISVDIADNQGPASDDYGY